MIKSKVIPRLLSQRQFVRYASKKDIEPLQIPFLDDLSTPNSDMLEYFPNLAGFYNIDQSSSNTKELEQPEYDFSEIPILTGEASVGPESKFATKELESLPENITKNYSTEDFEDLQEMTNLNTLIQSASSDHFDISLHFSQFMRKLDNNDTEPQNHIVDLKSLSSHTEPMTILSKFNNPYINLALEYYIYDNMPVSDKNSRLVIYKNKPCIVIGKNQNPFKEINMHYSNITSTPILRRLSGGGTVVHDLGNLNFSFMSKKSNFDRTSFTDVIVADLNLLIMQTDNWKVDGHLVMTPSFPLGTIAKGDIINVLNGKKISGSAFKLSKGKFLHHGTMLLDSYLPNLKKLLHLTPGRKESITANGTDSVSSSVENYPINESLFLYSLIKSYNSTYNGSKDNLHIIDNYDSLPQEVFTRAKELSHWSWVFGKTPYFKHALNHDKFKIIFEVEKSCIKTVKIESEDSEVVRIFEKLIDTVENGESVRYIGKEVASLVLEPQISSWLSWEIDYNSNYENFGVDLNN